MSEEATATATEETTAETTATTETTTTDWRASLPEDIRADTSIADFKDVSALAKSFIDTKSKVGANNIVVPGKNATDDERNTFFNAIGRPENVDGYKVPTENMPEGVTVDDGQVTAFHNEAHRLGFTEQQAAAMVRFDANRSAAALKEIAETTEQAKANAETQLRKEYGHAYDQNIKMAQKAIDEFGGEELRAALNESGWGNDPAFIRFGVKVGRALAEDEVIGGGGRQSFTSSPAEAKATLEAKKLDPQFIKALQNESDIGHAAAQAEWSKLFAAAYPDVSEAGVV